MNYSRLIDRSLSELRFVFLGAGSANFGIVSLLETALQVDGVSQQEARALVDSVTVDDLESGKVYPSLIDIRRVSLSVATAVTAAMNDAIESEIIQTSESDTDVYDSIYGHK